MQRLILLLPVIFLLAACSEEAVDPASIIFTGEHIITMDDSEVAAVAVRGDRIIATGAGRELNRHL